MAPPLPPPGVPDRAGLAPLPIALLWFIRLLSTTQDTPMLLIALPFEHVPFTNVLRVTYTGSPCDWLNARTAPPPMSGPVDSHVLPLKYEFTILRRPPRSKIAPPPPPSNVWPVELPLMNRMFC